MSQQAVSSSPIASAPPSGVRAPAIGAINAAIAPYVGPDIRSSIWQLASTLALLAAAFTAMYQLLAWSPWATLALALPTGGILVRTFIIMHDCAHGSFLPWRRVNDAVGFVTGVLTLAPFEQWRRDHALHHASSGDLDRRGHGDVPTLTVEEYLGRTPAERRRYRFIRHPATLLLLGPLHLAIGQRMRARSKASRDKQQSSVRATNIAIAVVAAVVWWLWGWQALALVYFPSYFVAASAGIWLFYVQHQFEDAYWAEHGEWDYATAALHGSSHLQLPPILRWFSGNIGLHHLHHLSPRIPNYRLQACHEATPALHAAPVITIRSGMKAMRLALWDEASGRLVRFSDVDARTA